MSGTFKTLPIPFENADESALFAALVNQLIDARLGGGSTAPDVIFTLLAAYFGVNVKNYGASGSAVQTTGSINAGSNLLTVTSVASFEAGQGLCAKTAGTQGAGNDLVCKILEINPETRVLTLNQQATQTRANIIVRHDDTEAFRAAVAASMANGKYSHKIFFPDGCYWLAKNWDAEDGLFSLPFVPESELTHTIDLIGESVIMPGWNRLPTGGVIIKTDLDGPTEFHSIFAARKYSNALGGDYKNQFSHVQVHLTNIAFQFPDNWRGQIVMGANCLQMDTHRVVGMADSTANPALSCAYPARESGGIWLPQTNNNALMTVSDTVMIGVRRPYRTGEHTRFENAVANRYGIGLTLDRGYRPNRGHLILEHGTAWLEFKAQNVVNLTINTETFPELAPVGFGSPRWGMILDPLDVGYGTVKVKTTRANIGDVSDEKVSITGGRQLRIFPGFAQWERPADVDPIEIKDDGKDDNLTVERKPLTADQIAVYPNDAIFIDEFSNPGAWHDRKPDIKAVNNRRWVNLVGGGVVAENVLTTAESGLSIGLYNVEKPDARVTIQRGYSPATGILLRAQDFNNYILIGFGDYNVLNIHKVQGGVLSDFKLMNVTTGAKVSARCFLDGTIRVWADDIEIPIIDSQTGQQLTVGNLFAGTNLIGARTGNFGQFIRIYAQ